MELCRSSGSSLLGRPRVPDDELPRPADLEDHRRTVADLVMGRRRLLGHRQAAPDLLTGVLVEGDGDAPLAPDERDQLVTVDQRVGGVTPHRNAGVVVLGQVLGPNRLAVVGVQADEVAHRAEGPDLSVGDDRRAARSGRVGDRVRRDTRSHTALPELASKQSTRSLPATALLAKSLEGFLAPAPRTRSVR